MRGNNICVAGIDLDKGTAMRLADPSPTRQLLRYLANLRAGDVVQVDCRLKRRPVPPHIEDAEWDPRKLKRLQSLNFDELCHAIDATAFPSVEAAFGPAWIASPSGNS